MSLLLCATAVSGYTLSPVALQTRTLLASRQEARVPADAQMALAIDLKGKTVFVAGVADSTGYGWAICKVSTWNSSAWPAGLQVATAALRMSRNFSRAHS
jgi:enoyl-[acyl-carrier protein] reductase I